MLTHNHRQRGYIALITVMLLSATLLLFASAVNYQGYTARFIVLDAELKVESRFLAEACLATARLQLLQTPNHYVTTSFPEIVRVGEHQCRIVTVTEREPNHYRVQTEATLKDAMTKLEAEFVVQKETVELVSQTEVSEFSEPSGG